MTTKELDERYCGHCDADTVQRCEYSDHERDSSGDRQECTVCGWWRTGMSGEWKPPRWVALDEICTTSAPSKGEP